MVILCAQPASNCSSVSSYLIWGLVCQKAFCDVLLCPQLSVFPVPQKRCKSFSLLFLSFISRQQLYILGIFQPGGEDRGQGVLSLVLLQPESSVGPMFSHGGVSSVILHSALMTTNLCLLYFSDFVLNKFFCP